MIINFLHKELLKVDIYGKKVKCPIEDTNYNKCIVYANDKTELVVQLVNDKYIFIEIEREAEYIKIKYENVLELKKDLLSYNLAIDISNFFVKKALIVLEETLNGK